MTINRHDILDLQGARDGCASTCMAMNPSIAEAAKTVEMTKTAANEAQDELIPRGRKKRFESDYFLL